MARSRFTPRDRQRRRQQARAWERVPPRPVAYTRDVVDGELEFADTARGSLAPSSGPIRLDYCRWDYLHAWDAQLRHHRRPRVGRARRARERVARAIAKYTTSRKRLVRIRDHHGNGAVGITLTITRCNHCGQSCVGEAADLVHLPGCPCSGESDE